MEAKINALEKAVQDHEPLSLKTANQNMIRAFAEVNAISQKVV